MTDQAVKVLALTLATGNSSIRDPSEAFARLAERIPNLAIADILAAADRARELSRQLKGLHHRLGQAREHDRRRAVNRR